MFALALIYEFACMRNNNVILIHTLIFFVSIFVVGLSSSISVVDSIILLLEGLFLQGIIALFFGVWMLITPKKGAKSNLLVAFIILGIGFSLCGGSML
jgi:hypothetical protein